MPETGLPYRAAGLRGCNRQGNVTECVDRFEA
jgi:hypothetical protein